MECNDLNKATNQSLTSFRKVTIHTENLFSSTPMHTEPWHMVSSIKTLPATLDADRAGWVQAGW